MSRSKLGLIHDEHIGNQIIRFIYDMILNLDGPQQEPSLLILEGPYVFTILNSISNFRILQSSIMGEQYIL